MSDFMSKLDELRILFKDKQSLPFDKANFVKQILRDSGNDTLQFFAMNDINFISQAAKLIIDERSCQGQKATKIK